MYFRLILFAILIYLLVRLVKQFLSPAGKEKEDKINYSSSARKIRKDVGDYVDFEETDKGKRQK